MSSATPLNDPVLSSITHGSEDALNPPSRTRRHTISKLSRLSTSVTLKMTLQLLKASPAHVLTVQPSLRDVLGSFSTTSSATASLRLINTSIGSRKTDHAHSRHQPVWAIDYNSAENSTPSSPSSSYSISSSIPSISRTASSSSTTLLDGAILDVKMKSTKDSLGPILAGLEKKSKFCTRMVACATCHKLGTDFPRCGKCGQMWCSRECRLPGGIKKHFCRRTSRI